MISIKYVYQKMDNSCYDGNRDSEYLFFEIYKSIYMTNGTDMPSKVAIPYVIT